MKNTTNVQQLQASKDDCHYNRLMKIFESIQTERIALSRDAIRSMDALQRWNCSSIVRSNATGLAKAVKAYLEKQTEIDALARKYGHENAVTIAETLLDRLHSLRVEYSREWNRLVSLAMKEKVRSIRVIQKVLTIVQRAMKHFRAPRAHRSRRFRLAVASAGSGGDGGSDGPGEPPRLPGLTGFPLASGWSE
jgi:hypothetical protein